MHLLKRNVLFFPFYRTCREDLWWAFLVRIVHEVPNLTMQHSTCPVNCFKEETSFQAITENDSIPVGKPSLGSTWLWRWILHRLSNVSRQQQSFSGLQSLGWSFTIKLFYSWVPTISLLTFPFLHSFKYPLVCTKDTKGIIGVGG